MDALNNEIIRDLKDLYDKDKIQFANLLNISLGGSFFSENFKPMYYSGDYSAKTVFVMLNPGAGRDDNFSFAASNEKSQLTNLEHFIEKYIFEYKNPGYNRQKIDNFDLKQAAFLFDFKDSGINIPDFFNEFALPNIKLKAQEMVLKNKLQLELIPYFSSTFTGFLDSPKKAKNNFEIFKPHLIRTLNAITENKREFVIFGSKQFYFLLNAYNEETNSVKFHEYNSLKIDGLQKKISFRGVEISYKGKSIKAIIAYTFPRRDIAHSYSAMRKYGEICFLEFKRLFQ